MTNKKLLEIIDKCEDFKTFKVLMIRELTNNKPRPSSLKGHTEAAKRVVAHLDEKTGVKSRSFAKAATRLADGFTEGELKLIVDWAHETWQGSYASHVTKDTLFRSKDQADKYLNKASIWDAKRKEEAEKESQKIEAAKAPKQRLIIPKL